MERYYQTALLKSRVLKHFYWLDGLLQLGQGVADMAGSLFGFGADMKFCFGDWKSGTDFSDPMGPQQLQTLHAVHMAAIWPMYVSCQQMQAAVSMSLDVC